MNPVTALLERRAERKRTERRIREMAAHQTLRADWAEIGQSDHEPCIPERRTRLP